MAFLYATSSSDNSIGSFFATVFATTFDSSVSVVVGALLLLLSGYFKSARSFSYLIQSTFAYPNSVYTVIIPI
jgi:hypothetical protein